MSSAQNEPETPPLNQSQTEDPDEVYRLFERYPFGSDEEFRRGLDVVIQNAAQQGKTQEDLDDLRIQAQIFFFRRATGHTITREGYYRYKRFEMSPLNVAQEPRQPSFNEIVELVKAGKTDLVPNNKFVPEGLNSNQPTVSTKVVRAKPWESAVVNGTA